MECADCKEQIALLLTDSLDESQQRALEIHLEGCPDCRAELETTRKLWDLMGEIPQPVPPASMRARFTMALTRYTAEVAASDKRRPLFNFFPRSWFLNPRFQLGYGVVLIGIGFLAGRLFSYGPSHRPSPETPLSSAVQYSKAGSTDTQQTPDTANPNSKTNSSQAAGSTLTRQIDSLSAQVSDMKQMMMLSLLENPSASQRIKAVSYTDEIGSANKKVTDALFTTLNEDPNVNVRLITLDALARFAKDPAVREGLIQSIAQQESPLLQSAIADVMVKLQEKRSIKPLEKLLQKKDINEIVKQKIEQSIQKLI